jgi:hypothetical protein
MVADVAAVDSPNPAWTKPVRVTFLSTDGRWKLVGLERQPSRDITPGH